MIRATAGLAQEIFDLLIIGGGIIGAGVARDAAQRGLRVALVEQADFASGTSSRSSKLIHGGFRYLEQYAFGLVAESCRERRILLDTAPHLVHPVEFLLPVYTGDPHSLLAMRLGMTLYDLLARYRNTAPHRTLSAAAALRMEPNLRSTGLRGAIAFYDCQEDDARLCMDVLAHAAELGAQCANYCRVDKLLVRGAAVEGATVTDVLSGTSFAIRARAFINAAGPWVEGVSAWGPGGRQVTLSRTKGTHILLPGLTQGHGVFFQSRQDRRMIFVIPWLDCTLVGTTDTDFPGAPELVHPAEADIHYLLERARAVLPGCAVERGAVLTAFAGVRPLLGSVQAAPSARSREHKLVRQGQNLLTIAGGKYTTFRAIAAQGVDGAFAMLGRRPPPCRTAREPIPDRTPAPGGICLADTPAVFESAVRFACQQRMAQSVSDMMWRRTGLALSRHGGPVVAAQVGRIMGELLRWSPAAQEASVENYLAERDGLTTA